MKKKYEKYIHVYTNIIVIKNSNKVYTSLCDNQIKQGW